MADKKSNSTPQKPAKGGDSQNGGRRNHSPGRVNGNNQTTTSTGPKGPKSTKK